MGCKGAVPHMLPVGWSFVWSEPQVTVLPKHKNLISNFFKIRLNLRNSWVKFT